MTLAAGTKLGPYEIISPLGSGGMGEVYKARDSKLKREVAIKVLPASLANDADALARFEREAHAVAALNHPNILSIHDFGNAEGTAYAVMELLEGASLRDRLDAGPLPVRRAVELAVQICHGLAAAHGKGVVHRDLKPDNAFVTEDGRVKILDFGLARIASPAIAEVSSLATETSAGGRPLTAAGTVMGTVGYMSPEQVRGRDVDARSDIFSFGAVLYEMLTGKRAFKGESAADTMSAILNQEPPDLVTSGRDISPALDRIVRHCLEKGPAARFQSAGDIAFALESAASGSAASGVAIPPAEKVRGSRARLATASLAAVGVLAGVFIVGRTTASRPPPPNFHRLTFQRGIVNAARLAPDGETVVYDAEWNGDAPQVFTARIDGTESRPFGVPRAAILALSRTGDLALALDRQPADAYWMAGIGKLALAPLGGGSPHPIAAGVMAADFAPDGRDLAIVRQGAKTIALEFPAGKALYETGGWIGSPRISPDGTRIAFLDYSTVGFSAGSVAVVDRAGRKTTVSSGFVRMNGLAWAPGGREIWFTASRSGSLQTLFGVTPAGKERVVLRTPGTLVLHDIARDGRVLLAMEDLRREIRVKAPGDSIEHDVTWLDYPALQGMSADGKTIAFTEFGEAGGPSHTAYVQHLDGSAPVRVADMGELDLSADGQWLLGFRLPGSFFLIPSEIGQPRELPGEPIDVAAAIFFRDGKRFVFTGSSSGHGARTYVQDVRGGKAQALTPEGTAAGFPDLNVVSPDGGLVVVRDPDGHALLWPVGGGTPQPIRGFDPASEMVFRFLDARTLLIGQTNRVPSALSKLDLTTGKHEPWRTIGPPDRAGVVEIDNWDFAPDLSAYAYNYVRRQSDLYLVSGLR